MSVRDLLQRAAMGAADAVAAAVPQPMPAADKLRDCRIISHRGEHDGVGVLENTLPAFEAARAYGVWGIECDVRWTADRVPVISHDPTGARVFGRPESIAELPLATLRRLMPQLPTLADVVGEFGGTTHLMLEIKAPLPSDVGEGGRILGEHLAGLTPVRDYHILALAPELFAVVDGLPRASYCLVAETNIRRLSRTALELGCGGLAGHYLLLGQSTLQRHHRAGQYLGTGFISSRHCLYRELNRGMDWIFSNHAVRLQKICDEAK